MPLDLTGFSIPLWALLVFYGLFLLFFFVYSAFNLYHMVRFGKSGFGLYSILALFMLGSLVLVGGSLLVMSGYDWSASFPVSSIFENRGGTEMFGF
jgi:hypothetical protein